MYYTYQTLLKYNAQTRIPNIARAHTNTFIPLYIKVAHTNIKLVMDCQTTALSIATNKSETYVHLRDAENHKDL